MNAKNLIAAATVFLVSGAAFAQPNTEFVEFTGFVSAKTRAEVKAELVAAGNAARNAEFVEFTNVASYAPAREIRATNDRAVTTPQPEFVEFLNVASTRTRAEVRSEVAQSAKAARAAIGS